jgi:hypothetical protein
MENTESKPTRPYFLAQIICKWNNRNYVVNNLSSELSILEASKLILQTIGFKWNESLTHKFRFRGGKGGKNFIIDNYHTLGDYNVYPPYICVTPEYCYFHSCVECNSN